MTQPDSPRHAPMKTQRQSLMNAVPYDAAPYMSASLLPRNCNIAAELQHCRGTATLPRNYNIAAELQYCRGTTILPRNYNIAAIRTECYTPGSVFLFLGLFARAASNYRTGSPRPRLKLRVAHGQTWIEIGCSNTRPACRRTSTPTDTPRCGILSRRRAPLMDTRPRSPTWARR